MKTLNIILLIITGFTIMKAYSRKKSSINQIMSGTILQIYRFQDFIISAALAIGIIYLILKDFTKFNLFHGILLIVLILIFYGLFIEMRVCGSSGKYGTLLKTINYLYIAFDTYIFSKLLLALVIKNATTGWTLFIYGISFFTACLVKLVVSIEVDPTR